MSESERSPLTVLHRSLMTIALIMLLFSFVIYVVYAANLINFPFDYDQGEGFELVDTIMFSQFQFPYQNTDSYPFYSSNYPPLFHIIPAPLVWIFGGAYWYGRLLGFIGTLITAALIGYVVYRQGNHRWIAVLSGFAFLASNTVYHIGPLFRQHMTMVLFETAAVVSLVHGFPQKKSRWIAFGLFMLICAGYTKQLAAITAVAVLLWLFMQNPRRGIIWGAIFAVAGGVIFAWLTLATNGEWWRQAIVANVNEFHPLQAFGLFKLWFQLHGFLIIPAVLFSLYELYFDRLSLYSIWFVVATLLGGIGSGTWGAGDSYFATSIAAMCILSGLFAVRTLNQQWKFRDNYIKKWLQLGKIRLAPIVILIVIPLLYIGYARATIKMPTEGVLFEQIASIFDIQPNIRGNFYDSASYDVVGYSNIGHLVTQDDIEAGYEIVDLIQASDAPVMSEEAGFSIVAGREVITNPTQLLNVWRAELYDGTELINMIENQEFGLIILRAQFYPVPVLEAIGRRYERDQVIQMNGFDYLILRPIED